MRIFNLDTICSFALYPDGNKKRNRNSQSYCLNVDQYSKNGSDETDTGTLKNHLKNLKVLCLGVLANESKNKNQTELGSAKFRVKKTEKYEVDKEFLSPNENTPFPFFLFYKKKKTKVNIALTDILQSFFFQIISLYKEKNIKLKKPEISKKYISDINANYQNEVTQIAKSIISEIEKYRPEVKIIGFFIDPYFIRKGDGNLILEDTRPKDTLPKKTISISHEQIPLDKNLEFIESESDSCESSASTNLDNISINDIFGSSALISAKVMQKELKTLSPSIADESAIDVVDGVQQDLETDKDISLELTIRPQCEKNVTNSAQSIYNPIAPIQDKSDVWNPETKKKITNLLEAYQKHLATKYFFRSNDYITESKKFITTTLLTNLKSFMPGEFYDHVYGFSTSDILRKHRDTTIIQKIGHFFKRHNKTEGTLLLKNIFSALENNHMKDTLSV
ncbi:hypothetical protein [Rickettsiella endosymbiont of Aleochara curtula]|uniref:hypothetical protein n=1 Tax=Rickettsiella endosymbiont of Aleochara curtula TaxID=3077936 RepID=UPI00313BDC7F